MKTNSLSVAGILFSVTLFLFPFITATRIPYGATNAKYFYVLGVTAFFTVWWAIQFIRGKVATSFFSWQQLKSFAKRPLTITAIAMLAVYFLAGIFGIYPARSFWSEIFRSSGVIFLSSTFLLAFVSAGLFNAKDWQFVKRAIVFSAALFSALFFFSAEGIIPLGGKLFELHGLSFGNTTFAGTFVLFGVFLTLLEVLQSAKKSKARYLFISLLLVQVLSPIIFNIKIFQGLVPLRDIFTNPGIILGSAQASAVAIFTGIAFVLIYRSLSLIRNEATRKVGQRIFTGISIVGTTVVIVLLLVPGSFIQEKYLELSTGARPVVWQKAIEIVKERPIFGWGPETFDVVFYKHFDNRLFGQEASGSEIWFDRAHNLVIDTVAEIGFVGLALLLLLYIILARTFWQAFKANKISANEAVVFAVLLFANILQLQTSFNTNVTYTLFAIVLGYGLFLERNLNLQSSNQEKFSSQQKTRRAILGACLIVLVLFSSFIFLFKELNRQRTIVNIFTSKNRIERIEKINKVLRRHSSLQSIRFTATGFIAGLLELMAKNELNTARLPEIQEELRLYEEAYQAYLKTVPADYRVHVNLVYLHFVQTILGENRLTEAKKVLEETYKISPNNLLTYLMDALAHLYEGDFKNAKRLTNEAIALKPDLQLSKRILAHIEEQEKTFPEITFLALENL